MKDDYLTDGGGVVGSGGDYECGDDDDAKDDDANYNNGF